MGELHDLPGVKGVLRCRYAYSIDEAIRFIRSRRAVTSAGSHGAVNIWRDDSKRLRSEFCRRLATIAEAQHEDLDCLRAWLNVWWPQMERGDEASGSAS